LINRYRPVGTEEKNEEFQVRRVLSQPRFQHSTSRIILESCRFMNLLSEFILITCWHTKNYFTQRAILVSSHLNQVECPTGFVKHSLSTNEPTSKHASLLPHATDYPVFTCGMISRRWIYGFKRGTHRMTKYLWIGRHVEGNGLI
jgi:hypothetical protein